MEKEQQALPSMTNSPNKISFDDEANGDVDVLAEFKRTQELGHKFALFNKLKRESLLGERYKNCTFGSTVIVNEVFEGVLIRCEKYCHVADEVLDKGYGMYIYGSCGTGKTHLAACMCNALLSQYQECMFTNFSEISKKIMATFSGKGDTEAVVKSFVDVDFLFIDDIGTESVKKNEGENWLQNQIHEIIEQRYSNLKPTIFTSNYSLGELIEQRGLREKTVDRIAEMSSVIMKLEGESFRLRKKKNNSVPF